MAEVATEQRELILSELAHGSSLRAACRKAGVKDEITIRRLKDVDEEFASQYARARLDGYEARADGLIDTASDEAIEPASRRIIVDTLKWELSKMLPKYADKVQVNGPDGGPVQHSIKVSFG